MGHRPVDHVAEGDALLPSFLGPRIRAVVAGCMLYLRDVVEDDLLAVLHGRHWPPSGDWSQHWGSLLGQPQRGMPDLLYRRVLEGQAAANNSGGDREDQIAVAQALFPEAAVVRRDLYPATVSWEIGPLTQPGPDGRMWPHDAFLDAAGAVLRSSAPGIVSYSIVAYVERYFGFEADDDAYGWDDGDLSEVI